MHCTDHQHSYFHTNNSLCKPFLSGPYVLKNNLERTKLRSTVMNKQRSGSFVGHGHGRDSDGSLTGGHSIIDRSRVNISLLPNLSQIPYGSANITPMLTSTMSEASMDGYCNDDGAAASYQSDQQLLLQRQQQSLRSQPHHFRENPSGRFSPLALHLAESIDNLLLDNDEDESSIYSKVTHSSRITTASSNVTRNSKTASVLRPVHPSPWRRVQSNPDASPSHKCDASSAGLLPYLSTEESFSFSSDNAFAMNTNVSCSYPPFVGVPHLSQNSLEDLEESSSSIRGLRNVLQPLSSSDLREDMILPCNSFPSGSMNVATHKQTNASPYRLTKSNSDYGIGGNGVSSEFSSSAASVNVNLNMRPQLFSRQRSYDGSSSWSSQLPIGSLHVVPKEIPHHNRHSFDGSQQRIGYSWSESCGDSALMTAFQPESSFTGTLSFDEYRLQHQQDQPYAGRHEWPKSMHGTVITGDRVKGIKPYTQEGIPAIRRCQTYVQQDRQELQRSKHGKSRCNGKSKNNSCARNKSIKYQAEIEKGHNLRPLNNNESFTVSNRTHVAENQTNHVAAYKDFHRQLRIKERVSIQLAEEFARESLQILPKNVHWKIFIHLAEFKKRMRDIDGAREYYRVACRLEPFAYQCWLEYSKLEENMGNVSAAREILRESLKILPYDESLVAKAIQHEEKIGNLGAAREILSRLKHASVEKVWRAVLEGALLEARSGNYSTARRVFKYLISHVPWYGPLYLKASNLERNVGRIEDALHIAEKGLREVKRYFPLYIETFRLCERLDLDAHAHTNDSSLLLPRTMMVIDKAVNSIHKELNWKIHLESAQACERSLFHVDSSKYITEEWTPLRNSMAVRCRLGFTNSLLACPQNLAWKVLVAGTRMELCQGHEEIARTLLGRAYKLVPVKCLHLVIIESAKLELFVGNLETCRAILGKARQENEQEWRIWHASITNESLMGNEAKALEIACQAIDLLPKVGRLWSILLRLLKISQSDADFQFRVLQRALLNVPRSGEVCCEAACLFLDPLTPLFDLNRAAKYLRIAQEYTPQYGDSFLEGIRIELLLSILPKLVAPTVSRVEQQACDMCKEGIPPEEVDRSIVNYARSVLGGFDVPPLHVNDLLFQQIKQNCINADPNYGLLWFHCCQHAIDTASVIFDRAVRLILSDISKVIPVYVAAEIRYRGIVAAVHCLEPKSMSVTASLEAESKINARIKERMLRAPQIFCSRDSGLTEGRSFITGLSYFSSSRLDSKMSIADKRIAVYGIDSLLP